MSTLLRKLVVLIVFTVLLFTMVPDRVAAQDNIEDYYPLEIGNNWTYRLTVEATWYPTVTGEMKAEINSKQQVGDAYCYVLEYKIRETVTDQYYLAWQEGKLLLYRSVIDGKTSNPVPPQVYLETPLSVGHKWTWNGKLVDLGGLTQEATMSQEVVERTQITVPAGTFDAYMIKVELKVVDENVMLWGNRWFARGVGLIKEVTTAMDIVYNDVVTVTGELTSYKIIRPWPSVQPLFLILISAVAVGATILGTTIILRRRKRIPRAAPTYHIQPTPIVSEPPTAVPSMKFCRFCGAKIRRDSKFCEECGAKVEDTIVKPEKAENKNRTIPRTALLMMPLALAIIGAVVGSKIGGDVGEAVGIFFEQHPELIGYVLGTVVVIMLTLVIAMFTVPYILMKRKKDYKLARAEGLPC